MTDRPIIFSGQMVRALLEGRKTQTRRVLRPDPATLPNGFAGLRLPITPGDRLWVREAWAAHHEYDQCKPRGIPSHEDIWRVADGPVEPVWTGRWRSPIHMPRWASRLTLTVTEVRVQRLQEISEADAKAEGVQQHRYGTARNPAWTDYKTSFQWLFDSLHGTDAWDANPWVVALTFTVHRGNIDARADGREGAE